MEKRKDASNNKNNTKNIDALKLLPTQYCPNPGNAQDSPAANHGFILFAFINILVIIMPIT